MKIKLNKRKIKKKLKMIEGEVKKEREIKLNVK